MCNVRLCGNSDRPIPINAVALYNARRSSEYREFAEVCIDIADLAQPHEKLALQEMAEIWLNLAAEQLEQESARGKNAPTTDVAQ